MSQKIKSWALNQSLKHLKSQNQTPEGACISCPNAIWQSKFMNDKDAEELKESFYYWVNGRTTGESFIVTCYCTLTHQYKKDKLLNCDGNPPQEEPTMD